MVDLLETLKKVKARYPGDLGKMIAANQAFMGALKFKLSETAPVCADPSVMPTSKFDSHESKTVQALLNCPEVFTVNLQWNGEPTPLEILRVLLSIPDQFKSDDLFSAKDSQPAEYIFKGMFCF